MTILTPKQLILIQFLCSWQLILFHSHVVRNIRACNIFTPYRSRKQRVFIWLLRGVHVLGFVFTRPSDRKPKDYWIEVEQVNAWTPYVYRNSSILIQLMTILIHLAFWLLPICSCLYVADYYNLPGRLVHSWDNI